MVHWGDKNTKLNRGYRWLCCSLCWQDPRATAKAAARKKVTSVSPYSPAWTRAPPGRERRVSSFSRPVSTRSVRRENGFPSCAQWTFASKEAYTTIAGGGVMSFNATAKAISRDKFSADRGSHRCCGTLFWGGQGGIFRELVNPPVISADRVHVLRQDVAEMFQEFLHAVLLYVTFPNITTRNMYKVKKINVLRAHPFQPLSYLPLVN